MKPPSSLTSIVAAVAAALFPTLIGAYDIGCIYPENMPDPMEARFHLHQFSGSYLIYDQVETPVAIHIASLSSLCQVNCLAYHDDDVLDALTMERPLAPAPPEYHNSWSRMLCMAQCFAIISYEGGEEGLYEPFWDKWGLEGIKPRRDDVSLAVYHAKDTGDASPLKELLENEDYDPLLVGQVIATEILLFVLKDGWNAVGEMTYDTETGGEVKCTANCNFYKDTTGYFPQNYPHHRQENGTAKYIVEGTDKYWQPLTDTDGKGFFSAQEHVTPHIGFKAKPKLYGSVEDFPQAPDPDYNYREESLQVVERLKNTSSDPIKKQKIALYDAKLMVINLVETEVKRQFQSVYSFEDEILYVEGMSAGEYDATLMAWREKVRHDLVRPTTVIKRWGSDILETFSGDKTKDGPSEIAARDFEAFQRVMPHSEYPSASACICTAYGEFTDAYTMGHYNGTVKDLPFGEKGEGNGYGCDPDRDPPLFTARGCEDDFVIPDMKTLIEECAESRLWAGFHFTAAVTEGLKMCEGVGLKAYDHVERIRNGSTFKGGKFYRGDPRPTCSDPNFASPSAAVTSNRFDFLSLLFTSVASLLLFPAL